MRLIHCFRKPITVLGKYRFVRFCATCDEFDPTQGRPRRRAWRDAHLADEAPGIRMYDE